MSLRCANALLCLVSQAPDWSSGDVRRQLLERVLPRLVSLKDEKLRSTLDVEGKLNVFTQSVYVDTLSQICQFHVITGAAASAAADQLQSAASELIGHASLERIGQHDFIPVHPFILFHVTHALRACMPHLRDASQMRLATQLIQGIAGVLRNSVERLLAKHQMGALGACRT